MGFADMDIGSGNEKFLSIKAGDIVQINIVSKEPRATLTHWINREKSDCSGKKCVNCSEGDKPRKGWKVNVFDRKTETIKEFDFGPQIAAQIKEIAGILKENGQTIHDIDLRIKREGAGPTDTEYFVNQVPKKGSVPEVSEEEVPF